MLWLLACGSPPSASSVPMEPDDSGGIGERRTWTVNVENPAQAYEFPSSGYWDFRALQPGESLQASFDAPIGHTVSFVFHDTNLLAWAQVSLYDGREASPGAFAGGWMELRDGELHPVLSFAGLEEFIDVRVSADGPYSFSATVENVSDGPMLGQGAFVVHPDGEHPLLVAEQAGLAELQDQDEASALAADLRARTGLTAVFGPGVWVVHARRWPMFRTGEQASPGLEVLAEDGNPLVLAQALVNEDHLAGVYGPGDGTSYSPVFPGQSSQFTVEAAEGELLSLAFMFSQSNDLFLAPSEGGVEMVEGDITDLFELWDAGTEQNQRPGFGPDQGPRQQGPDTGPEEEDTAIRPVDDGFDYPELSSFLRITMTESG